MARPKPKKAPAPITPPPAPPPLTPSPTTRFGRDAKLMKKRGEDMEKFRTVIDDLCSGGPLAPDLQDHPLKGTWKGWRDCHVAPDWIIVYRKTSTTLLLARTGTHADLFE